MSPVVAAAIVVFCEGMVLWAVFPIMNYYCADFGGGPVWVGILFALMSGPRVIFNPLFGRLSERFGRRPLMAVASLGTLASSVAWATAPNLLWLAVSRLLAGIFGAQAALSSAVVADVTPVAKRGPAMGMLGAAFGLSMILGPLMGGLVTHFGSHALVGWAGAVLQAVSVLTCLVGLRETRPPEAVVTAARPKSLGRGLWALPNVTPLLLATLISTLAVTQITTTFSMLAKTAYDYREAEVAYFFAMFGLIATLVQGGVVRALVPRVGDKLPALVGLVILALGGALIALGPPRAGLWAGMCLVGIGAALSTPTITALVSACAGADRQGELLGLHQGVTALARGLGAPLAGGMFRVVGASAPYGLSAVISVAAVVLLAGLRVRSSAAPPPAEL